MTFKLRSGNSPVFKGMGSSPTRHDSDIAGYNHEHPHTREDENKKREFEGEPSIEQEESQKRMDDIQRYEQIEIPADNTRVVIPELDRIRAEDPDVDLDEYEKPEEGILDRIIDPLDLIDTDIEGNIQDGIDAWNKAKRRIRDFGGDMWDKYNPF